MEPWATAVVKSLEIAPLPCADMPYTPFMPSFDQLPAALPIFPLTGAVVMPGVGLPLNIFEPRYLNMVADAMNGHHMFGMMQPDPSKSERPQVVFQTGCAGRITSYHETEDGRMELILTGVCRFRVSEELKGTRGYRVVVPDWKPFRIDYEARKGAAINNRDRLLYLLRHYFLSRELETDWQNITAIPSNQLVNSLTTALPLSNMEKQAMLEAVSPQDRVDTLIAALETQMHEAQGRSKH
jgi:Lon protease-like protein